MASLIPGYEYDIFISYRQKDNKHDGWVTEFVDNLKGELESMFKDEVSVYFDINPSDYLLESYDVDASLKDKLKCLIFIPIISRTYCDPKSFAWDNELKVFINDASRDKFGFKIKLPNGNVANRVLPIRIHDLDIADVKLFESVVGGVLRSIDFVYKETGVNRQLRAKDDDIIKNPSQILYRDQINKVALTIKDIIESMKSNAAPDKPKEKEVQVKDILNKKEIRDEEPVGKEIIKQKQEVRSDKIRTEKENRFPTLGKTRILVPGILGTIAILLLTTFLIYRHSKVKWAKEKAVPEIYQLADNGKYIAAFDLAKKAEEYIPNNPELKKLWSSFSTRVTTKSDPPGARVYRRDYDAVDTNWIYVGETPLDSIPFPFSFSRIKIEKEGFQTVYDVSNSMMFSQRGYLLDKKGTTPKNMVHIPGIRISFNKPDLIKDESIVIGDYFIDRYEVTNKEYKIFVDSGGYQKKLYWNHPFTKNNKILDWEEAMSAFVDKTGRPGPATWEAGTFLKDEDDYPVSGVSWYEAAAYAEFIGKSLPTYYHWRRVAGFDYRQYLPRMLSGVDRDWGFSFIIPKSNLNAHGPAPVGTNKGMTGFGTCDMVGNVREWCWNETSHGDQRFILGGGWNDPTYIPVEGYVQPSFDRSQTNGFRCVYYLHADDNLKILKSPINRAEGRNYMNEHPVSDQQFEIFKRMFAYEKSNLNAKIESEDNSESNWINQKISFDAAYGNERVIAHLFLPKSHKPPYQLVVYFPGSSAGDMLSSESLVMNNLDYIIKDGRAVMYPVYKGTYERRFTESSISASRISGREHVIQWYKDLARSIDYLESRSDIDTSKIAYFGFSWGGRLGPVMAGLENRIKVCILYVAGLSPTRSFPEVDPFTYVHRLKIPTLMLNGKYDADFPYETSQKPLFELLGASPENKHQYIYESGHFVPRNELIKETLKWLDKYLGPVK